MKKLLLVGIFAGAVGITAPAHAHGFFSLRIGIPPVSVHIGVPAPVPVYSAPVVVAPPVVCAPRRIVIAPRAVIVRPRVCVPPPAVIYRPRHGYVVARPYCW
jgi:hypothetical protein